MAKAKKTVCPISRQQFKEHAKALDVSIAGQQHTVPVKFFSTGSLGWYLNGKTTIEIDGQPVQVQIGLNLTIVGSKDLPKEEGAAAPAAEEKPEEAPATSESQEEPAGDEQTQEPAEASQQPEEMRQGE